MSRTLADYNYLFGTKNKYLCSLLFSDFFRNKNKSCPWEHKSIRLKDISV